MSPNPLRSIPSVNELLENPVVKGLVDRISHNTVVNSVRTVLDEVRLELQASATEHTLPSVSELADRIARRVLETDERSLRPVINATGIVLHAGLGRTILAEDAAAAIAVAAGGYASVELDLVSGKHRRRNHAVEGLLKELTGAEAALVLNNNAGGTLAALAALAAGREVVVSRGHLIQIGCSYRLAETVAASGAVLREVGSVNRTTIGDYADAIGERTAALLLVHPSNCTLAGSSGGAAPAEVIDLARRRKLPLIHDIGAGALVDFSQFGLVEEPLV
ncbi:MAG: L-seryl-tRNA(Sec) selenium transferase, partial [Pirellulales bacterium]|nr:L-seryl-tRNA(Sec) selenium transferase [Pirellulales bacterium]